MDRDAAGRWARWRRASSAAALILGHWRVNLAWLVLGRGLVGLARSLF